MPQVLARYLAALFLTLFLGLTPGFVHAQDDKEYLVKATFIYNFLKFIEWPGDKGISKQSAVDICVVGNSPLSSAAAVFQKASTDKLKISLVSEGNAKNITGHCHIVFIGGSEEEKLAGMLADLKGQPVLTVSDIDKFAERGGMIGFVIADNKVRLVVNTKTTEAAGLHVDARLLEIALKVLNGAGG